MKLNIKRNLKKKTHREKINNFFSNVHPSSSRDEEKENERKKNLAENSVGAELRLTRSLNVSLLRTSEIERYQSFE